MRTKEISALTAVQDTELDCLRTITENVANQIFSAILSRKGLTPNMELILFQNIQ